MANKKPGTALVVRRPDPPPQEAVRRTVPTPRAPAATEIAPRIRTYAPEAPPVFWGDSVRFDDVATHELGALWALAITKYAYTDSSPVIAALKTTIGADSIDVHTFSEESMAPKMLEIHYPEYQIFVVRGTTMESQKAAFMNGQLRTWKPSPTWLQRCPPGDPVLLWNADSYLPQYFGTVFEPFVTIGESIWTTIRTQMNLWKGQKKVYFIGHSLGAAILDLCVNRMAKVFHDHLFQRGGPSGYLASAMDDDLFQDWELFEKAYTGSYLFSSPRVGYYGLQYKGCRANGDVYNIANADPVSRWRYSSWPWWYYSRYTRHTWHQGDPVPFVPMTSKDAPLILRWAIPNGTNAELIPQRLGVKTTYGHILENEEKHINRRIPTSRGEILERATAFHGSGQLLRMFSNAVYAKHPNAPDAWSTFIAAALEINGDSHAPWAR